MAVDPATTIPAFDTTLPNSAEFVSEGDDNFRMIKSVLKTTFPNLGGAWNATQVEANYLVGVTSSIQSQLNAKGARAGQVWTGAHDYTGATVTVPTLAQGTNTTGAASAAFVQAEWSARLPNYTVPITASSTELNYSVGVTSGIQGQINAKGARAGQAWTGTHDFTGASITVPTLSAGSSGNGAASVDYVNALSFASALPAQAGNSGKFITTNGSSASWSDTINGNLNFTGTGRRITGDFSNATIASRTMFQASTTNAVTSISAIPNGTGGGSNFSAYAQQDPANASRAQIAVAPGVSVNLSSDITGSGSYLPLLIYTGGVERLRIDQTTGNVLATSGAIGYGAGAGGTATQSTSKNSPVTLNKPSGRISTSPDNMPPGGTAFFQINNTFAKNTDGAVVGLNGNVSSTGTYLVEFLGCVDGGIAVKLTNTTGINIAESVQINFQLIKGAIS